MRKRTITRLVGFSALLFAIATSRRHRGRTRLKGPARRRSLATAKA